MRDTDRPVTDPALPEHPPVLVVDRDRHFTEAVRTSLAAGHLVNPVLACPDPREALGYLTGPSARKAHGLSRAVAVVVSFDFGAHGGQRLLRSIGQSPPLRAIPVVVVGQGVDEDEVHEAMDLGATAYLSKLVASHVLLDLIRAFDMPWALAGPTPEPGAV